MENLHCWQRDMKGVAEVKFLLFLDCPQEVMLERLLERYTRHLRAVSLQITTFAGERPAVVAMITKNQSESDSKPMRNLHAP